MAKKKVIHMFAREDIVRSVLKGHKVTAPCGYVATHTREGVDAVPDWVERGIVKFCTECFTAVNGTEGDVAIHPSRGWLDLLERVWASQYDSTVNAAKITICHTGTFNFPLAG